jgi:PD-(D/E)XK nuclease superfamily protein
MNTSHKGRRNEWKSIAILESQGYRVSRSAASKGVFDLVGIKADSFVLCQVKTRDWPGTIETEEMRNFPAPPNCRKVVHRWRDRQSQPDIREIRNEVTDEKH